MKTITTYILLILLLCYSCSVRKYIPDGRFLYKESSLKITPKNLGNDTIKDLAAVEQTLENLLYPKPNSKILGMRLGLLAHYKTQQEHPGFFYKFLAKKIGEEPVYLKDSDRTKTEELIENRLRNRGFFKSEISSEVVKNENTAAINYSVTVQDPYTMATYQVDTMPNAIKKVIQESLTDTPLKKGERFDLKLFKLERERIDQKLKKIGYYNFNADFLIFEADTNQYDTKKFDLFLRLKKEVPPRALVPYEVSEINVHPNYEFTQSVKDTVMFQAMNFVQDSTFFKPKRLAPYITFAAGEQYSPEKSRRTSKRLSSLGTYKFVNIRYEEIDSIDDPVSPRKLRAAIFLSPLKKRALKMELQAVSKSNNFVGPTLLTRYSNRNLFKGGETLNISGSIGYETQLGGQNSAGLSSLQLGLNSDLIFPRLLTPIRIDHPFEYEIPTTKISAGVELLDRSKLYRLNSFTTSFGYGWNANRYVYHKLNPISINYVNLSNKTAEFEKILNDNSFLRSSFDQQFIAGLTYSFQYNELSDSSIKNPIFAKIDLDIAGNVLSLLSGKRAENEPAKSFLNLEYAQYVKADIDLRYHIKIADKQQLVSRVFAGWGLAYGNSQTLPFSKQFFSGGPYSVRAFRIRSLGPGIYTPKEEDTGDFFDRSGDIRLEANLEYRFPLFNYVFGAAFVDAGNVWLTKENDALPGGKFTSDFVRQLGVGAGLGVRVDIQNFVIRFDLAVPIQKPFLPKGKRFDQDLKEAILNFAIGYPF